MEIGDRITVRGEEFTLSARGPMGTGKFFGKRTFTLTRVSDRTRWTAYGKTVSGNSKLTQLLTKTPE